MRLRRAVLLRALVVTARDRGAVARGREAAAGRRAGARRRRPELAGYGGHGGGAAGRRGALRGSARARQGGDRPARSAATCTRWRASRKAALPARAVELALSDDVPMQDFSSYIGVLLGNRATREAAFAMIRDRWTETRAKADSPMILRRLVEALAALPERRHYEDGARVPGGAPDRRRQAGDRADARADADGCGVAGSDLAARRRLAAGALAEEAVSMPFPDREISPQFAQFRLVVAWA